MNAGFVPALGTPLDKDGNIIESSYKKQIEMLLEAGSVGVLAMGTMGQQAYIKTSETIKVAKITVDQVKGRIPIFVGAMDNSIHRTRERIAAMEDLDIAGFVFTTPYYHLCSFDHLVNYYKGIAAATKHSIFLYDLPGVTQTKITFELVVKLIKEIPNLAGIKTADMQLLRKLKLSDETPDPFLMMFSSLDVFDIGYKWGLTNYLDGMVDCTPVNFSTMDKAFKGGNYEIAAKCLSNVVSLRDLLIAHDILPAFSAAMNLLGCEGNYAFDYTSPVNEKSIEAIRAEMKRIGEL